MPRVLIVYATREGQTEKIARRIGTVIEAMGIGVELMDAERPSRELDLERFAAILVGSPVRSMGYLPPVVRFAREHRPTLNRVSSAFFSVSLAVVSRTHDGRAQTLKLVDKLIEATGWRPSRIELIAGALPYSKYNFLLRWVMRRIAAKEGGDTDTSRDYEYTDWEAVDRFAREFVEAAVPPAHVATR
jgi:menaquinone-dependent protoporphyrinogen oxidase